MALTTEERRRQFEAEALPHLDAVFRYAHALAGDPARAEDLTQETMFKAFRAWERFRPGSNARAWLLTILRNTFINEYRRRQQPLLVACSWIAQNAHILLLGAAGMAGRPGIYLWVVVTFMNVVLLGLVTTHESNAADLWESLEGHAMAESA